MILKVYLRAKIFKIIKIIKIRKTLVFHFIFNEFLKGNLKQAQQNKNSVVVLIYSEIIKRIKIHKIYLPLVNYKTHLDNQ